MGLCPKPRVWGELTIFRRRKRKHRKKKILEPFDFGAAHARVRPWVKNPLVGWACSFLLDRCVYGIMRCQNRHAPIGGCLVHPQTGQ